MSTRMPKGITRGYSNAFLDALNRVPMHKALTVKELKDLDDAELRAVIEAPASVNSEDEAA